MINKKIRLVFEYLLIIIVFGVTFLAMIGGIIIWVEFLNSLF